MFGHVLVATDLSAASETVCRNPQGLKTLGARRTPLVHALDIRHLEVSLKFITPACAEKRQQRRLKDGFAEAGVPMDDKHRVP